MGWGMGTSKGDFGRILKEWIQQFWMRPFLGLLEFNAFSAFIGFGHFQLLLQREGAKNFD